MNIKEYIKLNKLNTNSRERQNVYKRFYMFAYLRKTYGYSYQKIGCLFNRNHATIIHGINEYEYFKKDKMFLDLTKETRSYFPMGVITQNNLLTLMFQILSKQDKLV